MWTRAVRNAGVHGGMANRSGKPALGAAERRATRARRLGAERGMTIREHTLERHGVEPVRETTTRLRPRNGPFHPPAARARSRSAP